MQFNSFQEYWDERKDEIKHRFTPFELSDLANEALLAWDACVNNYPFTDEKPKK